MNRCEGFRMILPANMNRQGGGGGLNALIAQGGAA